MNIDNLDWGLEGWSQCPYEQELTKTAQNITTITDKIMVAEELVQNVDNENTQFMLEQLLVVLRSELEREYKYRDLWFKAKAIDELMGL